MASQVLVSVAEGGDMGAHVSPKADRVASLTSLSSQEDFIRYKRNNTEYGVYAS